jgi:hypothetical protein
MKKLGYSNYMTSKERKREQNDDKTKQSKKKRV